MHLPSPSRRLPERPDLDQLKRQAKELLEAFVAGEDQAVAEVNRYYHDVDLAKFALHDAQLDIYANIRLLLAAAGRKVPSLDNVPNRYLQPKRHASPASASERAGIKKSFSSR